MVIDQHGLRKNDIIAAFSKLIQRATNEYEENNHIDWPVSPDDLISALEYDYMTMNTKCLSLSNVSLNKHGFATTEARNIANKIWSIASDWTALITGRKRFQP